MCVTDYIKQFTVKELRDIEAWNNGQLIEKLNIDNPLAIMTVKVWLAIRRERMEFERSCFSKIKKVKKEVDKYFDLKERIAKKKLGKSMFEQMRRDIFGYDEEDLWEDCEEEYFSEDGSEEMKEETKG